jgi:hypothetical protein
MKKLTCIGAIALAFSLAGANRAGAQEQPASPAEPKLPAAKKAPVALTISKETTYITGPLGKDGYVDYVAALNERFQAGVTPDNNAAVHFLKAMGPVNGNPQYCDEYCKMLGIQPLPEKGDYFVPLDTYAKTSPEAGQKLSEEEREKGADLYAEQLTRAMKRAWSKKEFPVLAGWLTANEKPMALLVAASKRPRRYDPLISADGSVITALVPAITHYREAARALAARAMFRTDQGQVDDAWEDLLACHRLARLVGQGPTLIDALVAVAVDGIACAGDQGLLQHGQLTPAQIAKMRADLAKLPSLPKMVDAINVGERFMGLDCVTMISRKGVDSLTNLSGGGKAKSKGLFTLLMDDAVAVSIDWDQVLRMSNQWYDRMADAMGKPTRAERQAGLDKVNDDLRKLAAAAKDWKSIGMSMLSGPRHATSERIGQLLMSLLLPAVTACANAEDRGTMKFEVTRLAFAVAAYRADRGAYPARLADLSPAYVAQVPKDIFNASELHYRQEADGFLLYSVGPNGKDDGGKGYDDRQAGGEEWDDLVVRVPATNAEKP